MDEIKRLTEINIPYSVLVFSKYDSLKENIPWEQAISKYNKEYSKKFKKFINLFVRTGNGKLVPFDRNRIKESLLKETDISPEEADKVSLEVQKMILEFDSDDYLNTSQIRDFVNIVLLKYKLFDIRKQYLRIGMPSYDLMEHLKRYDYENITRKIFSDFVLSRYLPKNIVYSYLMNELYFHGLPGFLNKIYYLVVDLNLIVRKGIKTFIKTKPPKYPEVFINQVLNYMRFNKKYVFQGYVLENIDRVILDNYSQLNSQLLQAIVYEFAHLGFETILYFDHPVPELEKIKRRSYANYPIICVEHFKVAKNFVLSKKQKGIADVVSLNLLKFKRYECLDNIIDSLERILNNFLEYVDLKNKYFIGNNLVKKITEYYPYYLNVYGIFEFEDVWSRRILRFIKKYISENKPEKTKIKLCHFSDPILESRFGKISKIKLEKYQDLRIIDKNIYLWNYFMDQTKNNV